MVNRQFVKTSLLSSLLFFIISTVIDFLLTWQLGDILSYAIFFVMSFLIFGPMIAVLVTDYRNEHCRRKINFQI